MPSVALVAVVLRALWRRARRPAFDAHRVKVVALTLLLWIPIFGLFTTFIFTPFDACIVFEDDYVPAAEPERAEPVYLSPPPGVWDSGEVCRPGASDSDDWPAHVIWAGTIDRKAVDKPKPSDTPAAWGSGTVAVAVLVDTNGRVLGARPLSGPPLLRHEAARAACSARFRPTMVDGAPLLVSGLLTYDFAP